MHAALGGWSMTLRWCVSSSIRHVTFQRPMISIYNRKGCGLARCCVRVRLTCTCIVRTYPAHLSLSLSLSRTATHIHSSRSIMYVRFVTGHACMYMCTAPAIIQQQTTTYAIQFTGVRLDRFLVISGYLLFARDRTKKNYIFCKYV
jgi:hypothetical protein